MFNKKNEEKMFNEMLKDKGILVGLAFELQDTTVDNIIEIFKQELKEQEKNKLTKGWNDKIKNIRNLAVLCEFISAIGTTNRFRENDEDRIKLLNYLEELIEKAK